MSVAVIALLVYLAVLGLIIARECLAEDRINAHRMSCRCCGTTLHRIGGHRIPQMGWGFCTSCTADVLEEIHNGS